MAPMRSRTANVESLEARQFFTVTPVAGFAEQGADAMPAAVGSENGIIVCMAIPVAGHIHTGG